MKGLESDPQKLRIMAQDACIDDQQERILRAMPHMIWHVGNPGHQGDHLWDREYGNAISCTMREAHILSLLADMIDPEAVIEIGTHMGWSAAHLGIACWGPVWMIDPWGLLGQLERCRGNVKRATEHSDLHFVQGKSPRALDDIGLAEDTNVLAFIDGDHTKEAPMKDATGILERWPNAHLVLHDVEVLPVAKAIREITEKYPLRMGIKLDTANGIWVNSLDREVIAATISIRERWVP